VSRNVDDRSGFLVVILVIAVVIVGSVSFLSLYGTKKTTENIQVRKEQDMKFEKLANLKVFFGHQSVGENIVQGMKEILSEHSGISFKIVEAKDLSSISEGTFVHAKIGRNTRPESKIRAFEKILTSAPPGSIDIALMKFCYVDLNRDSDPEALFETYSTRIAALGAKLPGTTFVHTTVPIESAPQGAKDVVKGWAKAVLRRPGVAEDNRVRERYNSLIRETFGGTEPIFDIASA
jgi:hypothetical protein